MAGSIGRIFNITLRLCAKETSRFTIFGNFKLLSGRRLFIKTGGLLLRGEKPKPLSRAASDLLLRMAAEILVRLLQEVTRVKFFLLLLVIMNFPKKGDF